MSLVTTKTKMADESDEPRELKSCRLEEVSFTPVPSQTNIYGLAKISSPGERNKVLLASLCGSVICLEFTEKVLGASTSDVSFTYIPGKLAVAICDFQTMLRFPKGPFGSDFCTRAYICIHINKLGHNDSVFVVVYT